MNKKNLSVVMAGAMLATSVAPVLADTTTENTYEVTKGNAGLLIDKLDEYFANAPKFDKDDVNTSLREKPVYTYQYKKTTEKTWTSATYTDNKVNTSIIKTLAEDKDNYEIQVIDLGHREENGKIVSTEPGTPDWNTAYKYSAGELQVENGRINKKYSGESVGHKFTGLDVMTKAGVVKTDSTYTNKTLTINLASGTKLELKENGYQIDFNAPVDSKGNLMTVEEAKKNPDEVYGFKYVAETDVANEDIKETVEYTINLVVGDEQVVYNTNDLYDGLMLTEKGHDLLEETKAAKSFVIDGVNTTTDSDGNNYNAKVTITDKKDNVKVVTIKGDNKARLETLVDWLEQGRADVDILAGENRYATAVEISKTFVREQYTPDTTNDDNPTIAADKLKNIVMVNGEALVDGLAAAPYAHALNTDGAPILLTADNKLPKETKNYLKELAANYKLNNLPTIHIVGGTSVISTSVVEELKDMGFKVKRIAGDNREETSLAVADKLEELILLNGGNKADFSDEVFVVGAEGEADAMSIASYAAASETPIIVSKSVKGLSTVGLNNASDFDKVTIIGGETVVPVSDEDALKEMLNVKEDDENVVRIAGSNRQATNAAVIKAYHDNFSNILVAKDGTNSKNELVDALAVSMFASANADASSGKTNAAPIVLATNKLSNDQINQTVLHSSKANGTLYQIGNGVQRPVMEKLADKLGLLK